MIKADILQMKDVQGHLNDYHTSLKSVISEMQEVERRLAQTGNLVQIKRDIEKVIEIEENNNVIMKQMASILETAIQIYSTQEEKIIDFAEEYQGTNSIWNLEPAEWVIPSSIFTLLY